VNIFELEIELQLFGIGGIFLHGVHVRVYFAFLSDFKFVPKSSFGLHPFLYPSKKKHF